MTHPPRPGLPLPGLPLWAWCWLAVVAAAMALRPPLMMDETRYLAVAWEMARDQQFLVPHLNGAPYSHKPPLLFWLMNLGWAVFGINDVTPRLVAPLFGLGTLALTARLARMLWPDAPRAAKIAPLILVGGLFFALFTTLTMFDPMLAFFAVAGLVGLIDAARGGLARGMIVCGVAIGFGVLAKGPAILLHVLPVALAAPWWAPLLPGGRAPPWKRWYAGVFGAVLLGAVIGLAWAIPAAIAGGPEFAYAIFIGQSAGRMVESFAHKRPFWWLAAWLPVLLLPWTIWPGLWRALASKGAWGRLCRDAGGRLIAVWFGVAFVAFSLISGKQFHYLLPEFPALALIAARLMGDAAARDRPARDAAVPALLVFALAAAAALLPVLPFAAKLQDRIEGMAFAWMALPAAVALVAGIAALSGRLAADKAPGVLALLGALLVVGIHLAAYPMLARFYDVAAVSQRLKAWESEGEAIAHVAKYHGQFHFAGRLEKPIAVIGLADQDIPAWLAAHPKGKIVSYRDRPPGPGEPQPLFQAPFRNDWVVVWDRDVLAHSPGVVARD
ncbi:MAG: glycosyltransferase family 39 protein [Pseudomonadota bacterium]